MRDIVAERIFVRRGGARVTARVYAPERIARSTEWSCRVEVEGSEVPFKKRLTGVDSLQALNLGLRLLYTHLDKIATTLSFLDGPEGDTMTPLIVSWPFGPAGKAEIDRYVKAKLKAEGRRRKDPNGSG